MCAMILFSSNFSVTLLGLPAMSPFYGGNWKFSGHLALWTYRSALSSPWHHRLQTCLMQNRTGRDGLVLQFKCIAILLMSILHLHYEWEGGGRKHKDCFVDQTNLSALSCAFNSGQPDGYLAIREILPLEVLFREVNLIQFPGTLLYWISVVRRVGKNAEKLLPARISNTLVNQSPGPAQGIFSRLASRLVEEGKKTI